MNNGKVKTSLTDIVGALQKDLSDADARVRAMTQRRTQAEADRACACDAIERATDRDALDAATNTKLRASKEIAKIDYDLPGAEATRDQIRINLAQAQADLHAERLEAAAKLLTSELLKLRAVMRQAFAQYQSVLSAWSAASEFREPDISIQGVPIQCAAGITGAQTLLHPLLGPQSNGAAGMQLFEKAIAPLLATDDPSRMATESEAAERAEAIRRQNVVRPPIGGMFAGAGSK
jgi:hypothetical protein